MPGTELKFSGYAGSWRELPCNDPVQKFVGDNSHE
jgi:hypothetical protein